jgi:hypothetical protein
MIRFQPLVRCEADACGVLVEPELHYCAIHRPERRPALCSAIAEEADADSVSRATETRTLLRPDRRRLSPTPNCRSESIQALSAVLAGVQGTTKRGSSMSEYRLEIPHRGRSQPLDLEAVDCARSLENPEQRAVAREVLWSAVVDSDMTTIGELLDALADPAERRRIGDAGREAAGLPTFSERERNQERARALRWPPRAPAPAGSARDEQGRAVQQCHAEGCRAISTNADGSHRPIADRLWWCPGHRDQAGPEDHLPPPPPRVRLDANGFPQSVEEDDFLAREYERVEAEGPRRRAEKLAELKRLQKLEADHRRTADLPPLNGLPWPRSRS